jgi:hypothetical protein
MMILILAAGATIVSWGWQMQCDHDDQPVGAAMLLVGALICGGAAIAMKGGAA